MIKRLNYRHNAVFSIVFAIAAVFLFGYQFNNGDQEEHLPYVYRLIDASLYQSDYIVPMQTSQFTIRFYFAYFIFYLSKLFTVEYAVLLVHVVSLFVINWAATSMAFRRSGSQWTLVFTPVFILLLNHLPVGGNSLLDIQLTCSMPAIALGMAGLNQFDAGRVQAGFLLAGLAACFQVLIGLHLGLLLLLCSIIQFNTLPLRKSIPGFLCFLVASSPMLLPIMFRQFDNSIHYDKEAYFNILFLFRNAHHYAPQCFDLNRIIIAVFVILVSMVVLFNSPRRKNDFFHYMFFFIVVGCIVYVYGFIEFRSESIAKTQWIKSNVWLYFCAAIIFSAGLSEKIKTNLPVKQISLFAVSGSLIGLVVITNSALVPIGKFNYRYKVCNYKKSDLQLMHEWIQSNTPVTARILSFPGDDSFLCEAKRSMPVGFKAIIHEPQFMFKWYANIQKFYGITVQDFNCGTNLLNKADSLYLASGLSALNHQELPDYRLIKSQHNLFKAAPNEVLIKQIGDYKLFKIN